MSPTDDSPQTSVQSYAPERAPESPFRRTFDISQQDSEAAENTTVSTSTKYEIESPFRFEMREGPGIFSLEAEEFVQLLANLDDEAFSDALFELMNEASEVNLSQFTGEFEDSTVQVAQAERFLQEHFAPLYREAEALLDNMAEGIKGYDLPAMTETEIETLLNHYEPTQTQLTSPSFEFFLGKLLDKAKKAVQGAANLAKKVFGVLKIEACSRVRGTRPSPLGILRPYICGM